MAADIRSLESIGRIAGFQQQAIVAQLGQYFRCLNGAMSNLRERLIINNTEMDEKLRDLQEIEIVGFAHKERMTLLDWKRNALKDLTIQYTKKKK